jgi:hypothetical protein
MNNRKNDDSSHKNKPVRPSLPLWKRLSLQLMPLRKREVNDFMKRIETEQDMRIFCTFGKPGPLPVNGCRHPVLLDGMVYDADALRELYLDPWCPDADPHHARSLISDALLLRANRAPVTDRNLRDMAPMLAQAAIEPFVLADGDPTQVMVRVASELAECGLMQCDRRGEGLMGVHSLTGAGRLRVEEHVRGKWRGAVN